ncbi:hypothetical protein AAFF_G00166450 [Aldrovandia affinis]|uniref:Uncharacterized protein n=1 Tax=Aldrovandia affinis TaxID=143900 RepID=A0AAD7W830_9TELE|nr:hypothetical protein AAFF_G00166450 [Aldrovandia affinis]
MDPTLGLRRGPLAWPVCSRTEWRLHVWFGLLPAMATLEECWSTGALWRAVNTDKPRREVGRMWGGRKATVETGDERRPACVLLGCGRSENRKHHLLVVGWEWGLGFPFHQNWPRPSLGDGPKPSG